MRNAGVFVIVYLENLGLQSLLKHFHLQGNEFSKIIKYDYKEKFPENFRRVTKVRATLFFFLSTLLSQ